MIGRSSLEFLKATSFVPFLHRRDARQLNYAPMLPAQSVQDMVLSLMESALRARMMNTAWVIS